MSDGHLSASIAGSQPGSSIEESGFVKETASSPARRDYCIPRHRHSDARQGKAR